RGVTVLYGGQDFSLAYMNDTWEWDGVNWAQVSTGNPLAYFGPSLAYDSNRGVTVLFGGPGVLVNDVWEWNGANWTHVVPSVRPPARYTPAMAYDSARQTTVLFG